MANGLLENAQAERLMPALRDTSLDLIGIGVEACSQSASLHDRLTTARRRAICLETRVTKVPMAHMPHQRGSRAIHSSGGTPCFGSPGNGPDRTNVGLGQSGSVRFDLGGRRTLKKKKK